MREVDDHIGNRLNQHGSAPPILGSRRDANANNCVDGNQCASETSPLPWGIWSLRIRDRPYGHPGLERARMEGHIYVL
jgi:hypothetical protein